MSSETVGIVYDALSEEPQTPNEVAKKVGRDQRTVQSVLLELANTREEVKWKKIGRYRLFWKKEV